MVVTGTTTPVYNWTGGIYLKYSAAGPPVLQNFTMLISSATTVTPSTKTWVCVKGNSNISSNVVANGFFAGVINILAFFFT